MKMNVSVLSGQDQDHEAYSNNCKGMLPILESYGGYFGYDFVVSEVLKSKGSDPINRVFTIEFPNVDAMKNFFSDLHIWKLSRNSLDIPLVP